MPKEKSMDAIEKYYNKFNEDKRLLSRHGQVEFAVTMKYIQQCVAGRQGLKILDVGAGTGRYSIALHEQGHQVCALEYVKKNLSVLKQNAPYLDARQGTALNLKKYKDESFDIVLLFGPMYHLFSQQDKVKALIEAKRVVKKDGWILVAYLMNEYAVITYAFKEGNLKKCLQEKMLDENFHCQTTEKDLYSYVRLEDIDCLNQQAGLSRKKIIGVDGATDYIRPILNKLTQEDFEVFVKYQMSICERQDLIGASSHTLDILQK